MTCKLMEYIETGREQNSVWCPVEGCNVEGDPDPQLCVMTGRLKEYLKEYLK